MKPLGPAKKGEKISRRARESRLVDGACKHYLYPPGFVSFIYFTAYLKYVENRAFLRPPRTRNPVRIRTPHRAPRAWTRARRTIARAPTMRACTPRASLARARGARNDERRATRAKTHRRPAVASPTILVKDGKDPETTTNGLSKKRRAVIEDMTSFAAGELSGLLKDPDTNWQPQDWLPNPESPDFLDQVRGRGGARGRARGMVYPREGGRGRSNETRRGTREARSRRARDGRGGGWRRARARKRGD